MCDADTSFEERIMECLREPCKREASHKYVHILLFGLVVGITLGHVMCAPVTNMFLHPSKQNDRAVDRTSRTT